MKIIFILILVYSINWIECTLRVADFCEKLEIDDEERKMQWLIESFQYFDVFKNSVG